MGTKKLTKISIFVPIMIMLISILCIFIYLKYPTSLPMKAYAVLGIVFSIILLIRWVKGSFRFDPGADMPSNATLTCKNGHTCEVWIDLTGWESIYGPKKNEIIYNVGGHDIRGDKNVNPPFCPKCGAAWSLSHKHNGRKR